MCKQNVFLNALWFKIVLLIICYAFSRIAISEIPVPPSPVNQVDYEPQHQGWVQMRATLFTAPCNLSFDKTLSLTGCGAGQDYDQMNLTNVEANTPVNVRFYDVELKLSSARYPLSLLNGSNPIHLPTLMKDKKNCVWR